MTAIQPQPHEEDYHFDSRRASSPILSPRLAGRDSYLTNPPDTNLQEETRKYHNAPVALNIVSLSNTDDYYNEKESPVRDAGYRQKYTTHVPPEVHPPQSAIIYSDEKRQSSDSVPSLELVQDNIGQRQQQRTSSRPSTGHDDAVVVEEEVVQPLKYAHFDSLTEEELRQTSASPTSTDSGNRLSPNRLAPVNRAPNRRTSTNQLNSGVYSFYGEFRGRTGSPGFPNQNQSDSRRSSGSGDAPGVYTFDNSHLKTVVGKDASLLSHEKTIELYRQNALKTNDPTIQYEFAVFLISAAQSLDNLPPQPQGARRQPSPARKGRSPARSDVGESDPERKKARLLKEAKAILQRLADRSFPYAQYFLADALCSGLFTNGKPDLDKAFPLFVSASKHGHAESGYRAALHYEYGWGTKKEPLKAVQFYRAAASRNHPGAMTRLALACLRDDLGITNGYREGLKWLKRATESADHQYPNAPFELARMHEVGDGKDIFKDLSYSAQLYAQAAELGHAEASHRLGEAYEKGLLDCPQDAGLSIHYYTGAAELGYAPSQLALCAWYTVGAPPLLEPDEEEAYAWALKAAERGLAKAEYTIGYFTEMGIGTNRDELEANTWYVRAAEHGEERAMARLKAINAAMQNNVNNLSKGNKRSAKPGQKGDPEDKENCVIM